MESRKRSDVLGEAHAGALRAQQQRLLGKRITRSGAALEQQALKKALTPEPVAAAPAELVAPVPAAQAAATPAEQVAVAEAFEKQRSEHVLKTYFPW